MENDYEIGCDMLTQARARRAEFICYAEMFKKDIPGHLGEFRDMLYRIASLIDAGNEERIIGISETLYTAADTLLERLTEDIERVLTGLYALEEQEQEAS